MLRSLALVVVMAGMVFNASAAQAAPEIGIINIQKISQSSKAAVSIRKQMQEKQKKFQNDFDKKQKEFLKEDQALVKQQNSLSKDAFEEKVREFQARGEAAKKEISAKRRQLDKGFTDALTQIDNKVVAISESIAKDKGYKIIISASQVLYADDSLDITKEVQARLDKELPKVSISF